LDHARVLLVDALREAGGSLGRAGALGQGRGEGQRTEERRVVERKAEVLLPAANSWSTGAWPAVYARSMYVRSTSSARSTTAAYSPAFEPKLL